MATYRVTVQRTWVEQGECEIEADSEEAARDEATEMLSEDRGDWSWQQSHIDRDEIEEVTEVN